MSDIGELKKYLELLEREWTEEDEKVMGKFEDQQLISTKYNAKGAFVGYDLAKASFDPDIGLIIKSQ